MTAGKNRNPRTGQGHGSLDDLLWLHKTSAPTSAEHVESLTEETLDSEKFARLFIQTYPRLDPKDQGLSKEHLGKLIMRPDAFTHDEYLMLLMVAKYFDTIANLVDDEPGPQTLITPVDREVLCQFLIHGKLSLPELHRWRLLCMAPKKEDAEIEGPPLSGSL
jgi:hypothetical protein